MKRLFSRFKNIGSRGDTLVEVLISIAIITLVVAIGYTVANRSLSNGTAASQRNQALALAQGQVEQLVNAVNSNNIDPYKLNHAFCIDPTNNSAPIDATTSTACSQFKGTGDTPYNVNVTYDQNSGIFTVKTTWSQATGNKTNSGNEGELSLYYKAPGLFLGKDVCPNLDGIQTEVPNGWHISGGKCLDKDNTDHNPPPAPAVVAGDPGTPPKCTIHSVVPSPNPGGKPSVNGDCTNGHCGSINDPGHESGCAPGGRPNATVKCDQSGCWCTVTVTDWNYSGTDAAAAHYWNCTQPPEPPAGSDLWPAPSDPTQIGTSNCPAGQYGDAGQCRPYTPTCPPGYQGTPCTPIPTTNPNTGNTNPPPTPSGCTPLPSNDFCFGQPTGGSGGTGDPAGGTGGTGGGGGGGGSSCVPLDSNNFCSGQGSGGGGSSGGGFFGSGCGFDGKDANPHFALMSWLDWILPKNTYYGRWC